MRVLPPGGPLQRVSSGPFPGAEPHVLCKAKPVKLKKVAFSHFFDTLMGPSFDGPFCMLFLFLFSGCRIGLSRSVCLPLLHLGVGKAEFLLKGREGIVGTLL